MQLLLFFIAGVGGMAAIGGSIFYFIIRVRDRASSLTNHRLYGITAAIISLSFFSLSLLTITLETKTSNILLAMYYVLGCMLWAYIAFRTRRKFFQEQIQERLSD